MNNPRLVLDTSVTMSWCFEDESDEYSDGILESLTSCSAIVPELWLLEVANVLLVAERRHRIHRRDTGEFLRLINELPIYVESADRSEFVKEIIEIGREVSLTSYDTAYLLLAEKTGLPLATKDDRLRIAAGQRGIPLFQAN